MRQGYARVSKAEEQEPAAQVAALRAAGCERVVCLAYARAL